MARFKGPLKNTSALCLKNETTFDSDDGSAVEFSRSESERGGKGVVVAERKRGRDEKARGEEMEMEMEMQMGKGNDGDNISKEISGNESVKGLSDGMDRSFIGDDSSSGDDGSDLVKEIVVLKAAVCRRGEMVA